MQEVRLQAEACNVGADLGPRILLTESSRTEVRSHITSFNIQRKFAFRLPRTLIGYQTNLMVYGPGGYRFADYIRFGAPLNIIMGITALAIIPQVWPLV